MKAALVIRFKGAVAGREAELMAFSLDSDEYWGKLAADGRCSPPEMYMGLVGWNLWMVTGELEDLTAILASEATQRMFARMRLLTRDCEFDVMVAGDAADAYSVLWAQEAQKLTSR